MCPCSYRIAVVPILFLSGGRPKQGFILWGQMCVLDAFSCLWMGVCYSKLMVFSAQENASRGSEAYFKKTSKLAKP